MNNMKRLVIDLTADEHRTVALRALNQGTSISNVLRMALGFPAVKRGVKRKPARRVKKGSAK